METSRCPARPRDPPTYLSVCPLNTLLLPTIHQSLAYNIFMRHTYSFSTATQWHALSSKLPSKSLFCKTESCYNANVGTHSVSAGSESGAHHRILASAPSCVANRSLVAPSQGRRLAGAAPQSCIVYSPYHCDERLLHLYEDLHMT